MGITVGQFETYLEMFQKMAYAKTIDEYNLQKNYLLAVALLQVMLLVGDIDSGIKFLRTD